LLKKLVFILLVFLTACTNSQSKPALDLNSDDISSCVPINSVVETGYVYDIIDGDTFRVTIKGENFKIRLIGIDSPEMDEPFYYNSKMFLDQLILNREVELYKDSSNTDQYSRLLRYVFVDDIFVNYEIVLNGYALNKTYPPDTACSISFSNAHLYAKENNLGLNN